MADRLQLQQLTAEQLRENANELDTNLSDYPNREYGNKQQKVAGRPDIGALYDKLNLLNRAPLDYSGLGKVNAARQSEGDREFLSGLAMQTLGGKTIAPAGKHVFEQALAKQTPIRPNAADEGWTNPETGEFVVNPRVTRNNEEKTLMNRIDAIAKEEQQKFDSALKAGNAAAADVARSNMEQIKLMMAGLGLQKNNNGAVQIQFYGDKVAGSGKGGTKPLQHSEQKDLNSIADAYRNLNQVHSTFKDEYAGGMGGTPGQEIMNNVATNFPTAMGVVMSKKGAEKQIEKSAWWAQQKRLDEMVERHQLFGSALTAAEVASWKAASIQPGMTPKQIRDNMDLRMNIMTQKAEQARNMHLSNQKIPAAVHAALGNIPMSEYVDESGAAPAAAAAPAVDPVDAALMSKYPKKTN